MKELFLIPLIAFFGFSLQAQEPTVDEIISNYLENTGGIEAWKSINGYKMALTMNMNGMEIPIERVQFNDGKQYSKVSLQGMTMMQQVYDGEVLWNTNFQSMKAEKADDETLQNFKLDINDFPDALIDYKEKGYTAELLGTETIEGAECYKVKVVKEPRMNNGEQIDDISFYYFEVESFVVIAVESEMKVGPMAGTVGIATMSDYQEVEGMYFPFSLTQGVKDGPSQTMTVQSIEFNPEIASEVFSFPVSQGEE